MLAAVAIARPEADPQFYHHGVVGHVHPTCENGADVLPVQSCAPRTEDACVTSDVMSQEIIYVKKCQNVVSKTCAPVIVSRLPMPSSPWQAEVKNVAQKDHWSKEDKDTEVDCKEDCGEDEDTKRARSKGDD